MNTRLTFGTLAVATTILMLAAAHAQAVIVTGETATASSQFTGNRSPMFAVNDSGLTPSGVGDNTATTPDQMHTTSVEPNMWLTAGGDTTPHYTVDLGAVYPVLGVRIFNYNESPPDLTARGVQTTDLRYSTSNASTALWSSNFTTFGTLAVPKASGQNTESGTYFAFGAPISARYFQFDVLTNWGDTTYTGLSELQFEVPEPSSAVLVILGSSAPLLARRRRSHKE